MFGIGMPELLLLLAIALIVIGPKKLPDLAKSLGRAMGEFKKATNDLKQSITVENDLADVKQAFSDMNTDIKETLREAPSAAPSAEGDATAAPTPDADSSAEPAEKQPPLDDLKEAFDDFNSEAETEHDTPSGSSDVPPASNGSETEKDPTESGKLG
jgi:TatA/E family protein of Tat protein translocase